ncbi:MAG: KilA-N domain-containing protein [Methylococcales bacterium]|nr:KilA-N domain-containing protein [Methylococcales bacterium]
MVSKNQSVIVQGVEVHVTTRNDEDYISLTDMTKGFNGAEQLVKNWLQNKNTIDFLGVWERLNNQDFNLVEFHQIKNDAGLNRFVMSVKQWVQRTGGIGLIAKTGRYGGTFAHRDIAFEFGSWLSPEFKLYLIKEFQRLKEQEIQSGQLEWNIRRSLTKANYCIHTDAIKTYLIPPEAPNKEAGFIYASEADLLNVALFGKTAKQWRDENPNIDGNIRDYAAVEQLVVLASLESQNALLIEQQKSQSERLAILNKLAISQMKSLIDNPSVKKLANKQLFE